MRGAAEASRLGSSGRICLFRLIAPTRLSPARGWPYLIAPRIPPGQAMGNGEWAKGNGQWAVGTFIWAISTWQRAKQHLKLEMRNEECAKGINPMFVHQNVVGLTNKNVIP